MEEVNFTGMSAFNKFKEEVLATYWGKHQENKLHGKLANPTPANLRDYALYLINDDMDAEDKKSLRDFFGSKEDFSDLERAISGFDIDKLKPVQYFINKKTSQPDESIVKLLAVFIDFQPRPFRLSDWSENNNDSQVTTQKQSVQTLEDSTPVIDPKTPVSKKIKFNKSAALTLGSGAILVAALGFFNLKEKKECMVWFKDRYIVVNCMDNSLRNKQIIPLDQEKLENFRKIQRLDTLDLDDVNKIWYSKVNNEVEFFTGPGLHPEHYERGLKLATKYIIEKYAMGVIQEEETENKSPE